MSSTLRVFIRFECFVYSVLSGNYSCCANKQHTRSNSPASNSSGCQYLVLFGKKWALSPIAHGARNLIDNKFRLPFTCKNYEFITAVGQNHGKLCSLVILQYILFKKKLAAGEYCILTGLAREWLICDRNSLKICYTAFGYYSCREEKMQTNSYCTHSMDAPCIVKYFFQLQLLRVTANSLANVNVVIWSTRNRALVNKLNICLPTCSVSRKNIWTNGNSPSTNK